MREDDQINNRIRFKLRYKIIMLVTAILISCLSIVTYFSLKTGYLMRKRVAQESMRHTATTIATIYATKNNNESEQLNQVVDSLMNLENKQQNKSDGAELFYIFVMDRKGEPVVANVNFALSRKYKVCLKNRDGEQIGKNDLEGKETIAKLKKLRISNLDRIIMPIKVNGIDHGFVEIAYFGKQFEITERAYLVFYIFALFLLCIAGVGVAIYMSIRITKPIQDVAYAMRRLAEGDMKYRLMVRGNDETIQLADGFNRMADSISRKQEVIRRNEEQLLLSERKYKVLFHNAGVGIMLLDNQKRCVEANERAEKMLGWPTDMLKGARLIDLIEPITDKPQKEEAAWTGHVVIPGGDNCEVEVNITNMNNGSFIGIFRDITHWRDQHEQVVNLQKKQNKLIQSLPHGIMTADGNLCISIVNDAFEKMTGMDKNDLIGKKLDELIELFGNINIAAISGEVLSSGKIYRKSDVFISGKKKGDGDLYDLRVIRYVDDESLKRKNVLIMIDKTKEAQRKIKADNENIIKDEQTVVEKKTGEGADTGAREINKIYVIGDDNDFLEMMNELIAEESFVCEAVHYINITKEYLELNAKQMKLFFIDTSETASSLNNIVENIYDVNKDVKIVLCTDDDFKIDITEIDIGKIHKTIRKPFMSSDIRAILNQVFQ